MKETETVVVRRQPGGLAANYDRTELSGLHWDTVSGGRQQPSPGFFLWGFVMCDGALEGKVEHSGSHGPCPHSIKVVVQKNDNADAFAELAAQAGPKPAFHSAADRAVAYIDAAGPNGITQQQVIARARLSKQHQDEVLKRIQRQGRAFRVKERRPDATGSMRWQYVWRAGAQDATQAA